MSLSFQRNVNHTAASLLTPGPLAAARRTRAIRARYLNQRCAGGTERKRPCGRCMTVATSGGRLRKAGGITEDLVECRWAASDQWCGS